MKIVFPIKAGRALFVMPLLILFLSCSSSKKRPDRIVIEIEVCKYFHKEIQELFRVKDEIRIQYSPLRYLSSAPVFNTVTENQVNGKVKWVLYSNEAIKVSTPYGIAVIMNAGDSLHVRYQGDVPVYSGTNVQAFNLLNELMLAQEKLLKPTVKYSYRASTLNGFKEWNKYINDKLALQVPIVDEFKDKIDAVEFEYYKAHTISEAEYERLNAFIALQDSVYHGYAGLTSDDLYAIWDSSFYSQHGQWFRSLASYYGSINELYGFNRMEVWRKFGFNFKNDSLNSKELRTYEYYINAKKKYKGQLRERLLAYILDEPTITELGIKSDMTQTILQDYYKQPGFPEYKQVVKGLEEKSRKKHRG